MEKSQIPHYKCVDKIENSIVFQEIIAHLKSENYPCQNLPEV